MHGTEKRDISLLRGNLIKCPFNESSSVYMNILKKEMENHRRKTKVMLVDYISDLHIDFWIKEKNPGVKLNSKLSVFADSLKLSGDADVLILGGDLGHYFVQDSEFLTIMKNRYHDVIIVKGNHDEYLISESIRKRYSNCSENRVNEMKLFCAEIGVHYLDGDIIEIKDRTFGGVGMTWDKKFIEKLYNKEFSDAEVDEVYCRSMNDNRLIKTKSSNRSRLNTETKKLESIKKVDLMITHYGPVASPLMSTQYKNSEVTTFFYFDGLSHIERINPSIWIHGHTHKTIDFQIDDTRVLCNPLGYPSENPGASVLRISL